MTFSKTVSVAITQKLLLKIYPNPTTDIIGIERFPHVKTLKIYNLQGVLLLKSTQAQADMSAFAAGFYILEAENTEGDTARATFVKSWKSAMK